MSSSGQTRVKLMTSRYDVDLWPLTFEVTVHSGDAGRPTVYTKFKVRSPSRSEDVADIRSRRLSGLVTLTLTFDL